MIWRGEKKCRISLTKHLFLAFLFSPSHFARTDTEQWHNATPFRWTRDKNSRTIIPPFKRRDRVFLSILRTGHQWRSAIFFFFRHNKQFLEITALWLALCPSSGQQAGHNSPHTRCYCPSQANFLLLLLGHLVRNLGHRNYKSIVHFLPEPIRYASKQ